jgi:hypothetical protein
MTNPFKTQGWILVSAFIGQRDKLTEKRRLHVTQCPVVVVLPEVGSKNFGLH